LPVSEVGGTLLEVGLIGTILDMAVRRDQEASVRAQFRRVLREEAPALRDAVVEGFAIHPEDFKRVATPELLDDLAANAMSLRLGDEQFARGACSNELREKSATNRPGRPGRRGLRR
jgi:hypothetical protein